MYAVYRLWINTMENDIHLAYGYALIGYVASKEEATRISRLDFTLKSKYPWPLSRIETKRLTIPNFICKEINELSSLPLAQLNRLPECKVTV